MRNGSNIYRKEANGEVYYSRERRPGYRLVMRYYDGAQAFTRRGLHSYELSKVSSCRKVRGSEPVIIDYTQEYLIPTALVSYDVYAEFNTGNVITEVYMPTQLLENYGIIKYIELEENENEHGNDNI